MGGLTGALNIAKNALLSFQTTTQVISHNISNVNNESYSRQKVIETTYPPSPSPVGPIGRGVKIEMIKRYFDAFLERNINLKLSDYGLFSAEETGLNILESLFNETQGSGLTDILKKFWNAWQNLANSPENTAARTQVIETGKLITEVLKSKFEGLRDLEKQIGLKLETLIDEINNLSSQIAKLNMQIIAIESGGKTANDLRDQRDKLIADLSKIVKIQYFETKEGAYNIILGKGFNLVNINYSWKLEVSDTDVYWVANNEVKIPLTSKEVPSGELGGWLKLLEQLSDKYNYEYIAGNRILTNKKGELISESDKLIEDLGLSVGDVFEFSGTDHFGNVIEGRFEISDDIVPGKTADELTVRDLLNAIENSFNFTVKAYIKDGRVYIEDQFRGPGKISFSFLTTPSNINFGSFDDPVYQRRVTELNLAGRLKLFGEELIKVVNQLHNQGVGLTFFTKELVGCYRSNRYIKELPYFLNLKRDGYFFLWVKDPLGKITPVKVQLNLSADATLNDLVTQINEAIYNAGFDSKTRDYEIRAIIRNGRLVFQAKGGYGFAFSNDTSRILLSTGINLFFLGTDPAELQVNPLLAEKPEHVSTGKLDVESYRSEKPFFGIFRNNEKITNTEKNYIFQISEVYIKPSNDKGQVITYPPICFYKAYYTENVFSDDLTIKIKDKDGNILNTIVIPKGTKIEEIQNILDGSQGIIAKVDTVKHTIEFTMDKFSAGKEAVYFTVDTGNSGVKTVIYWDQTNSRYVINFDSSSDTLSTLIERLDDLPFLRAYFDGDNSLIIRLEPDQTSVYAFEIGEYFTGNNPNDVTQSFLTFLRDKGMIIPSFRWNGTEEERFLSGLEPLIKPSVYCGDANISIDTTTEYKIKFFDAKGNLVESENIPAANSLTELIQNFQNINGIKAGIYGDKFYIWLDITEQNAPSNAKYFIIEDANSGSWGMIKTENGYIGLKAGEIAAYLFDKNGQPIDAFDLEDQKIDPFRIELNTGKSMYQIFDQINAPKNRQYGLFARLDREGRLIIETTGLYETKSFILIDEKEKIPTTSEIISSEIDVENNTYFYLSDLPVDPSAKFSAQTLTITLYKKDGTTDVATITINSGDTLDNIIDKINSIDIGNDGKKELSAEIDDESGKLRISIKNLEYQKFKIATNLGIEDEDNFVAYLYFHLAEEKNFDEGLINNLSGYKIELGDNRIAQAISDTSTKIIPELNHSNLSNYYASLVGEVGVVTKSVKDTKSFLEDLLRQLKTIKDSISGVSLDEEMTNLIKYQQAFIATSKILSTVEEMFQALINAKR